LSNVKVDEMAGFSQSASTGNAVIGRKGGGTMSNVAAKVLADNTMPSRPELFVKLTRQMTPTIPK